MKNKAQRIVFTGGHAGTTALATIEEFKKRNKDIKIYWIGPAYSVEGKKLPTLEYGIFPKLGVEFIPIFTGRVQPRFTLWTIPSLLKIPFGFIHALVLLIKIKPKVVVSYGGFAAFPVVVISKLLGINCLLHEQTMVAGVANKFSSPFVKKVALARAESAKYFPSEKTLVTGNPILSPFWKVKNKEAIGRPPLVFVTCGSRGSVTVNNLIGGSLEKILAEFRLVHQVGRLDFQKFLEIKEKLPQNLKDSYEVYETISPWDMPKFYERADIIISRAGANTVSEIIATKRPAILIPIPWSHADEQTQNAQFAQEWGIGKVFYQEGATPERLFEKIKEVAGEWTEMIRGVERKTSPDRLASKKLVELIQNYL